MTLLNPFFGTYGGQYVPEVLMPALDELERAYVAAIEDPSFKEELNYLLTTYAGRPTPLTRCRNLTRGTKTTIYLKREDLLHGGAHKTNQVIGKCRVYMGKTDAQRQQPNVFRMRLMGAEVVEVEAGRGTLKEACNAALADYAENFEHTHYMLGTAAGPHPFPTMVREFQKVIGAEAKEQILKETGRLPDAVFACVGGGSNAIGMFTEFLPTDVPLFGVEPAGRGLSSGYHGATLGEGTRGIFFGAHTYNMQDDDGQINESYSVSAGLDFPSIGPQHAYLKDTGRVNYISATDNQALEAFAQLSCAEGIIPALESSHALAGALSLMRQHPEKEQTFLVNLSGRGDKDIFNVNKVLAEKGCITEQGNIKLDAILAAPL